MTKQTLDPQHFPQKARRIRVQVSTILTRWGLLPRFKRWRLTQDPSTGLIVLFGILNDRYIATQTSIPFGEYFDRRVLYDLANELQVQVVSCNSDDLRYAFILDRGEVRKLPTHIDFPVVEKSKLQVRVVYSDSPPSVAGQPEESANVDDHSLVRQGVGAFLKVFENIKLRDDAALQLSAQEIPPVVIIDEDVFNKQVAEHAAKDQKIHVGLPPT